MVRVNLLPQKKELRRAAGDGTQQFLMTLLGVVVFELVVIFFVHKWAMDDFNKVKSDNAKIEAQIADIKRQMSNHTEIKSRLTELRAREDAINKLQSGRTGPTAMLLELSRIMTAGRGPTTDRDKLEQLRRDNPSAAPNVGWDTRRLYLTDFKEADKIVKIQGMARDGEDVSEFLKRLTLSDFFTEVRLQPASKVEDAVSKQEMVKFELVAKVRY
jgi:type IV pilus assembly protein PilN